MSSTLSEKNLRRFRYNAKDVCYTLAIDKILTEVLANEDQSLQQFYVFQQSQVSKHITTLMHRGVNVDNNLKELLKAEYTALQQHARELLQWLVHDDEFNPDSHAQVKILFKELCGMVARDKKGKAITKAEQSESFGAKAMLVYLEEYPEWRTLLHLYLEYKRLGVFVRTFLSAKLSEDGKMRCSYNVAGTKTYRLASRKNIDGGGLNLQNLPSGSRGGFKLEQCLSDYRNEESEDSLEDVVDDGVEQEDFKSVIDLGANFGRVKDMFVPPEGYYIADIDLTAGDLHFVVYKAGATWAIDILLKGDCVYRVLAEEYYGYPVTKKMEERQDFKAVVHGADYRGGATTLAAAAGLSVPEVYRIIKSYFLRCPEIEQQLLKDESEVQRKGYLTTVFGARLWIPDFKDPMWTNKNAAAPPQSSVGTYINKGLCLLEETENPSKFKRFAIWTPEGSFKEWGYSFDASIKERYNSIKVIMQVHDSAPCIFRKDDITAPRRLIEYYSQPVEIGGRIMKIPVDIKVSDKSYGDCNSELAKELLAKADEYILNNPDWRSQWQLQQ